MKDKIDFKKRSDMLKVLGHPVRLRIVSGLMKQNKCNVNKMVEKLNLPQSTVSQHLSLLKSRGIIAPVKDGVSTCYQVIDERVRKIITILQN